MLTREYLLLTVICLPMHGVLAQAIDIPANSLAIGLGYNSVDSYQFGDFSGIADQGSFAIGQLHLQSAGQNSDSKSFWSFKGRDLGLNTGGIAATYNQYGRFKYFLNAEQLPHYRIDDGSTPFRGSGSDRQTLPGNWVGASSTRGFTALAGALLPVEIDKKRQRITTGLSWQLRPEWTLGGEYRHETKSGEETLGAIFGSTGGNPRGALLARPIDFQTDDASISLAYAGDRSQYSASYNLMLFSNKDHSLDFQNPFNNPQWVAGANFSNGAFGQLALEPDTSSSQFSINGAHSFADGSRLSGSVTNTRLQQDDSFLPYSSAIKTAAPLPRTDLDGRVDNMVVNLNYSRQLHRRLLLRLRYNYQDRDNKTPQSLYLRVAADSAAQASLFSIDSRRNRIYDLQSSRLETDLSYRLGGSNKLGLGFEHEEKDRSAVDVATTKEDTVFVKYNFAASSLASGWLKLSRAERDASFYDSTIPLRAGHNPDFVATLVGNEIFENDPFLRRYHLTDRNRDEISAAMNFSASAATALSVLARNSSDDYPDALIGLQESERRHLAFDLSYNPQANWQASIYYNIDNYDNRQTGYSRTGGATGTPFFPAAVRVTGRNWSIDSEDRVNTVGTNVDWSMFNGRLQLELDTSYADAVTTTIPFSSALAFQGFPDVTTLIRNVSLRGKYALREDREIRFSWFYENYQSADWALDDVNETTLANILLLGNLSPQYSGHLFMISYLMQF